MESKSPRTGDIEHNECSKEQQNIPWMQSLTAQHRVTRGSGLQRQARAAGSSLGPNPTKQALYTHQLIRFVIFMANARRLPGALHPHGVRHRPRSDYTLRAGTHRLAERDFTGYLTIHNAVDTKVQQTRGTQQALNPQDATAPMGANAQWPSNCMNDKPLSHTIIHA